MKEFSSERRGCFRSTAFALRRLLNATCRVDVEDDPDEFWPCYPLMPHVGPTAELLVTFVISKAFLILKKFSGEKK